MEINREMVQHRPATPRAPCVKTQPDPPMEFAGDRSIYKAWQPLFLLTPTMLFFGLICEVLLLLCLNGRWERMGQTNDKAKLECTTCDEPGN